MQSLHVELEHEKETTRRVASAATSSMELSSVVSEMAKFRGESSRLEVELAVSNRKTELLMQQVQGLLRDADDIEHRAFELQQREEQATQNEEKARKALLELTLKYEGGLTREEADDLRSKHEKCSRDLETTQVEMQRHREMAEIASLQAKTIRSFREQHEEELNTLREHCVKLESRGDDDILIGRLQRQLMSTKTSYKVFTRKFQYVREKHTLEEVEPATKCEDVVEDNEQEINTVLGRVGAEGEVVDPG
jgi:chromosome segregation ATPase